MNAAEVLPGRSSDAGPQEPADERATWDTDDWVFEARYGLRNFQSIMRDDPKVQRKLRLEAIDLAIDALKCARELVVVE